MMQKLYIIFKRYKITIITALVVLLIGICGLVIFNSFTKNSSIKKVNEDRYAFQYDTTWKLKEKKEDSIVLKHNSGSRVTIQITELADEYRYATIDELIDELIYNIQKQNNNYKLISKKEDKLTKYEFNGYKLLYENEKEQVMVNLYKKSDKLVSIRFEANNDYFDILLDSVHNIVYNLDIKDKKFNLKNNIKLDTSEVEYSKSDKVDNVLKDSETFEISKNHYLVEYSLPSNFMRRNFDSTLSQFDFKVDDDGSMDLVVDIYNRNIYEYLDKEETINVYKNYSYYHKDGETDYSDFKETLTKLGGKYVGYIYKNSFLYNKAFKYDKDFKRQEYKRQDENVELIYALDNNHTLVMKIKSTGLPITQKLINMIKITNSTNYASYVKGEKAGNFLIGRLQRFTDYNKDKIDLITIKVPDKYEEVDKNDNIYLKRDYGWNYDEDMNVYNYNVHYELTTLSAESVIKTINSVYVKSTYGESHKLTYSGNLKINSKEFKVYDGGYTDISGIMFTNINRKKYYVNKKVLFYEMSDKGNLYIEISGNGKDITNEIINELVNFTIEEKKY